MQKTGMTVRVIAVLALFVVGIFTARVIQLSKETPPPVTVEEIRDREGLPVVVAEADRGDLEVWRTFSGTVRGDRESILRAKGDEEIREVRVRVGDRVAAGQLLVRQAGGLSDARVRQADLVVEQAERRVERLRPLWEAGALSEQQWEEALTGLELARADRGALGSLRDGVAPIAGVVTEVPARVGAIPSGGDPLVRIVDDRFYRVPVLMSPEQAGEVEAGQPARLAGELEATGAVDRLSIQADLRTRLVEVEVRFPGGNGSSLRPGAFLSLGIQVASVTDAVRIPRAALRPEGVWVVGSDQRAELRSVEVGLRGDGFFQVLSGIAPGERVVVEGSGLLSEGALVRVVN